MLKHDLLTDGDLAALESIKDTFGLSTQCTKLNTLTSAILGCIAASGAMVSAEELLIESYVEENKKK